MSGTNDGPDNFYLGRYDTLGGGPTPIPLPTAEFAGGTLLVPLVARRVSRA